jgi:hypothetical protein
LLGTLASGGSLSEPNVAVSTLGISILTFALASLTDAFGGMLVGLVSSAAFTAVHQYVPDAHPAGFSTQALTLGLLFLLGMSSGLVADRFRRSRRIAARTSGHAVMPVEGSLGLMSASDAAVALAHEVTRAKLHQRPLTTATVVVDFTDGSLGDEEVRRARRAVARSLETELRVTDVVYVDDEGRLSAILPETEIDAAVDVVESALMVARAATFADRTEGFRKPVADVAVLRMELTPVVEPVLEPVVEPVLEPVVEPASVESPSADPTRAPVRRKSRTSKARAPQSTHQHPHPHPHPHTVRLEAH